MLAEGPADIYTAMSMSLRDTHHAATLCMPMSAAFDSVLSMMQLVGSAWCHAVRITHFEANTTTCEILDVIDQLSWC